MYAVSLEPYEAFIREDGNLKMCRVVGIVRDDTADRPKFLVIVGPPESESYPIEADTVLHYEAYASAWRRQQGQ